MTFAQPSWYIQPRPEPAVPIAAIPAGLDEAAIERLLTHPGEPISGFPLTELSHPRRWLARLLFRRGQYWRTAFGTDALPANMPANKQRLLPALNLSPSFPPTILLHGTADSTIAVSESEAMVAALTAAGVEHSFVQVVGKEHGFDIGQGPDIVAAEKALVDFVLAHAYQS